MTKEEYEIYKKQLDIMQKFISQDIDEDPNELVSRLSILNVYIAQAGQLYAEIKKAMADEMQEVYASSPWIWKAPATVSNRYIETKCSDALYLDAWCERLTRALVHISDNCRTIISYKKQEIVLTRTGY